MNVVRVYQIGHEGVEFDGKVQIETVQFGDEQDALDWADGMGYLDHPDYQVTFEDNNGTGRIL